MVLIPRCGYLTSYKNKEKNVFDQVENSSLVFFIEKLQNGLNCCKNGIVFPFSCAAIVKVANKEKNLKKIAIYI